MDQKNEDAKECRTSINKNHGAPFESVFHRKNEKQLAERIAAFRKKQEKKQQKIKRILEKREAKKAAGLLIEDANEVGHLMYCTELYLFILDILHLQNTINSHFIISDLLQGNRCD